jgi:type I restriction enzyme S subunit
MQKLLQPKEGWEVKKLGEICDVRDGTHDSPLYFDSGVKFVTSKNIINGKINFNDISFISKADANLINQRSKVDKGDILMSMIGTIGNAVFIDFEPDFCIKNVALLKPKLISPLFLIQLMYSSSFQIYIESKLDGGIQKFISLGVLRNLDIHLPSQTEQTRIATILSDMDAEIDALETKLEKYRNIKIGMMQNLLTGKIRLIVNCEL